MRNIINLFVLTGLISLVYSCKKDIDIEVDSLNKAGEEFYFGERVPVWTTSMGGDWQTQYEWSATGGSFDGWMTQNLFENLWVAPNQKGEYTVSVTARNGSKSSTRSTKMNVVRYFFDEFQNDFFPLGDFGWLTSNLLATRISGDTSRSRIELTSTATAAPNIRRNLNLAPLKFPLSIRTRLGYNTWPRANTTMVIRLFFNQPSNPSVPYIREIRWEIWPTNNPATQNNFQIRYETFLPALNQSRFSAVGNVFPNPLALISPVAGRNPIFQLASGQLKNFTFSIDANNVFHTHVDGELWFSSNGIKDWLDQARAAYPGFEDPFPREFRIDFPGLANATAPATNLIFKHIYINDDGDILR